MPPTGTMSRSGVYSPRARRLVTGATNRHSPRTREAGRRIGSPRPPVPSAGSTMPLFMLEVKGPDRPMQATRVTRRGPPPVGGRRVFGGTSKGVVLDRVSDGGNKSMPGKLVASAADLGIDILKKPRNVSHDPATYRAPLKQRRIVVSEITSDKLMQLLQQRTSPDMFRRMCAAFRDGDTDGDGRVTRHTFHQAVRTVFAKCPEKALDGMLDARGIKPGSDGKLDYQRFLKDSVPDFLSRSSGRVAHASGHKETKKTIPKDVEEVLHAVRDRVGVGSAVEIFRAFDMDGNGSIEAKELYSALKHLGLEYPKDVVDRLVLSIDEDNDGVLQLDEVQQFFRREADRFPTKRMALRPPPPGAKATGNAHTRIKQPSEKHFWEELMQMAPILADCIPNTQQECVALVHRLDKDVDDFVTREELQEYFEDRLAREARINRPAYIGKTVAKRCSLKREKVQKPKSDKVIAGADGAAPPRSEATPFMTSGDAPGAVVSRMVDGLLDRLDTNKDGHVNTADMIAVANALNMYGKFRMGHPKMGPEFAKQHSEEGKPMHPSMHVKLERPVSVHTRKPWVKKSAWDEVKGRMSPRVRRHEYTMAKRSADTTHVVSPRGDSGMGCALTERWTTSTRIANESGLSSAGVRERLIKNEERVNRIAARKARVAQRIAATYDREKADAENRALNKILGRQQRQEMNARDHVTAELPHKYGRRQFKRPSTVPGGIN